MHLNCTEENQMTGTKSYSELSKLKTFEARFEYLKIGDQDVGEETFGGRRYLNQQFYSSHAWKKVRDEVIARDLGRDLGVEGEEIPNGVKIIVHHINPVTETDLREFRPCTLDPENLISTRKATHDGLHYGDITTTKRYEERKPGDTRLW